VTKRSIVVVGLVSALALVAAGCGGEQFPQSQARQPSDTSVRTAGTGASPQARLLAAAQRTSGERTSRIGLTMRFSGGGADPGSVSGSGVIDLVHQQLSMTVQGTVDGGDVTIDLRVVGNILYVDTGDGWADVPLNGIDAQTPDPSSYLDYLQGVSGDAHVAGHEVLRGDDTTRYEATLDLDRALTRVRSSAQRSALSHAIGLFGDLKMPSTVWVDHLGRLRKMQISMDLTPAARSLGVPPDSHPAIEMTLELYDFGVPVVVHAPADAQSAPAAAADIATESDLRNGLTAAKTDYTDNATYTADLSVLKQIEPSLDWGGKLSVVVGAANGAAQQVVCLSERSESGKTLALADVASGPRVGTYYGTTACPSVVDQASFSSFSATGWH
jgi:hypothetical protein